MDESRNLAGDLRYVQEVIHSSERRSAPKAIYFLWAALCLVGFALVDFAPRHVGTFWMIAGPAGFLASAGIGWWYSRTTGLYSSREGIRYMLHWLGTLVAVFLTGLLVADGQLDYHGMARAILLVLALGYFTAGLYQERAMVWLGLLLVAAYIAPSLVTGPVWTIAGCALAVSLVAAAFLGGRREPV